MSKILGIFLFFISVHFLILSQLPIIGIPAQYFPFKEIIELDRPHILVPLASFDGGHYITIAKDGYLLYQEAFFPLYPLLINIFAAPLDNHLIAGIIITCICFFLGIFSFVKLAEILTGNKSKALWVLFLLLSFPTAFFYITVYPESLFLFLASSCLYFIYKKNYPLASIFAVLASLTKLQGVFLAIPFVFSVLDIQELKLNHIVKQLKARFGTLIWAITPILGLIIYSVSLLVIKGDPFAYYHAQDNFGANRSTDGIILLPQVIFRYLKIIFTSDFNFQYFVAFSELLVFSIFFTTLIISMYKGVRSKKLDVNLFSLNLYSTAILLLPTLTGTLSSIPRYALISYGFFFIIGGIKNKKILMLIIFIFALIQILAFIYFGKGYFIG